MPPPVRLCRRLLAICCTIFARSSRAAEPASPARLSGGCALPSPSRSARESPKGRGRLRLRAGSWTTEYSSRARRAAKPAAVDPGAEHRRFRCGSWAQGWCAGIRPAWAAIPGVGRCAARQVGGCGRGAVWERAPDCLGPGSVGVWTGFRTAMPSAPLLQALRARARAPRRRASLPGRRCAAGSVGALCAMLPSRALR